MRLSDAFCGLLVLLSGCAVILYARTFPAGANQHIGPGLFPMLVGVGLVGCGATLFGTSYGQRRVPAIEVEAWLRQPRSVVGFLAVIGAILFYALAVDTLGFFLTAFVFLSTLFLVLGVRRRWIAPLAATTTLVLHFAFYTLLRVPLPWGWFEGFAW